MQMIERGLALLETAIDVVPVIVWAIILGLAVSWGGTQWAKRWAGLSGLCAAVTAFVLGFAPTYAVAPGWGWTAFWVAVAVGFCSPLAYKALIHVGRHRGWVWIRALSGDRPS